MRRTVIFVTMLLMLMSWSVAQEQEEKEKLKVFLSGRCDDPAAAVVESSLRESIISSSGYTLVQKQEPGVFLISLACVNAGEGWVAVGYH